MAIGKFHKISVNEILKKNRTKSSRGGFKLSTEEHSTCHDNMTLLIHLALANTPPPKISTSGRIQVTIFESF